MSAKRVPLRAQIESDVVARVSVLSAGARRYSATRGTKGATVGGAGAPVPPPEGPKRDVDSPMSHDHRRKTPLRTAQAARRVDDERVPCDRRMKTARKMKVHERCCVIGTVWRRRAGRDAGWTLTARAKENQFRTTATSRLTLWKGETHRCA